MKEYIKRLERSHEFWAILGLSFLFFLLRLPSLFEPYWYGDEGIYEVIGLALTKGRILYTGIWDNKPPLLYYTYALVHSNQFAVRSLSLIAGIGAVICFFVLAQKLLKERISYSIATILFVFLFGSPMFEGNIANAENFMLLPIIAGGFLVYLISLRQTKKEAALPRLSNNILLAIAGLLVGIAFLYKIVAIFDFAAFFVFLIISTYDKVLSFKRVINYLREWWRPLLIFVVGFILPFFLTVLYFALHKALGEYIHAILLSNVGYVGYKNVFIIPQGLLISKVILLGVFCLILFLKRQLFSQSTLFILLWLAFSLFNSFFSQRPYTHYVLVLIPAFSLLIGKVYLERAAGLVKYAVLTLIIGILILHYFDHWNVSKTISYYTNFLSFTSGHKSLNAYDAFFDRRVIRDEEIISYLNNHKKSGDTIYVWGNDAQIYPLTQTIPPGRFTVAYHVLGSKQYVNETGKALQKEQPKFIVMLRDVPAFPYSMYNYRQVLGIENADIYERIY